MTIRLGLGLPQMRQYDIGRDVPAVARAAEESGYESLWVSSASCSPSPRPRGSMASPACPGPISTGRSPIRW
jgi:alkanesulfonate monooxygenase SsuD/methylene tetrahydromethanopterin reductase-like flavin-dependent oxidoreductase (luciferase family)